MAGFLLDHGFRSDCAVVVNPASVDTASGKDGGAMPSCGYAVSWRTLCAAAIFALTASAAGAAELDGVTMPDLVTLAGATLHLNGIGLRTYSLLRIEIYIAGLYLQYPSKNAEAILDLPEKKVLVFHFLRDVDAQEARKSWSEGFDGNCRLPCRLNPADLQRFLAAVPAVRAGENSTLTFLPGRLTITVDGKLAGIITDPTFARAVLATIIGPDPPTERLKRELLGTPE